MKNVPRLIMCGIIICFLLIHLNLNALTHLENNSQSNYKLNSNYSNSLAYLPKPFNDSVAIVIHQVLDEFKTINSDSLNSRESKCAQIRSKIDSLVILLDYPRVLLFGGNDMLFKVGMSQHFKAPPTPAIVPAVERNPNVVLFEEAYYELFNCDLQHAVFITLDSLIEQLQNPDSVSGLALQIEAEFTQLQAKDLEFLNRVGYYPFIFDFLVNHLSQIYQEIQKRNSSGFLKEVEESFWWVNAPAKEILKSDQNSSTNFSLDQAVASFVPDDKVKETKWVKTSNSISHFFNPILRIKSKPDFDFEIINEFSIKDRARNISVGIRPSVYFNVALDIPFEHPNTAAELTSYTAKLGYARLYQNGLLVPFKIVRNPDSTSIELIPAQFFLPNDSIAIEVKVEIFEGTQLIETEIKRSTFFTGDTLNLIPKSNIFASYPAERQLNFHPEEYHKEEGYIMLNIDQSNIIEQTTDGYYKRMRLYEGEKPIIDLPFKYDKSQKMLSYNLPSSILKAETYYQVRMLNLPLDKKDKDEIPMYMVPNTEPVILGVREILGKRDSPFFQDTPDDDDSIIQNISNEKSSQKGLKAVEIFNLEFRTSKYKTLKEKLAVFGKGTYIAPIVSFENPDELFDCYEIFGPEGHESFIELEIYNPTSSLLSRFKKKKWFGSLLSYSGITSVLSEPLRNLIYELEKKHRLDNELEFEITVDQDIDHLVDLQFNSPHKKFRQKKGGCDLPQLNISLSEKTILDFEKIKLLAAYSLIDLWRVYDPTLPFPISNLNSVECNSCSLQEVEFIATGMAIANTDLLKYFDYDWINLLGLDNLRKILFFKTNDITGVSFSVRIYYVLPGLNFRTTVNRIPIQRFNE